VFSNDYRAVNRAVEAGKLLSPETELGRSFAEFAAQLLDQPDVKQELAKLRFLEYFRLPRAFATPGRD
jgi:hypothetical protein